MNAPLEAGLIYIRVRDAVLPHLYMSFEGMIHIILNSQRIVIWISSEGYDLGKIQYSDMDNIMGHNSSRYALRPIYLILPFLQGKIIIGIK